MIITLTGFMGCGKSSVGRYLSELLCCPFIDLDNVIEETQGRSIPEIFTTDGEAAFRQMELETLTQIIESRQHRGSLPSQATGLSLCGQMGSTVSVLSAAGTANCDNIIIALGGGAVMTPECADLVREKTHCIYLRASVDTLLSHLEKEAACRPMLQGASLRTRIEELMALRNSTYESTAHLVIDTDGRTVEEIATALLHRGA